MSKSSVKFNFFTYGRFVLTNGLSNGSFSGTVYNAGKDNTSFF